MTRHGPVSYWSLDDTAIPKKGKHSVGVARQWCGVTGKQDNCQVAVSLSIGNDQASLPVGYRLYLPEEWAQTPDLRRKGGVPDEVAFKTKWQIGLDLIDKALASGKPQATVLADAGYGDVFAFRHGLTDRGLVYAVGIKGRTLLWGPGSGPVPPQPWNGIGRPQTRWHADPANPPKLARDIAMALPAEAYLNVTWREGTLGAMRSRFAALRVRPANSRQRGQPEPEEWLVIEWPGHEPEPTKYWLSTLPEDMAIVDLVRHAKARWRIERDYQELKDELGLDHYEGRNWRGFHHHASLCIAAYAFLVAERSRFSPLSPCRRALDLQNPPIPTRFRRRGSPEARTTPKRVDHDVATTNCRVSQPTIAKMSDLPTTRPARSAKTPS
jgi:SRSO17 transposase